VGCVGTGFSADSLRELLGQLTRLSRKTSSFRNKSPGDVVSGGLVIRSADAVLAIVGSLGTLGEIGLAVRTGVVTLDGWQLPGAGPVGADSVEEAVSMVLEIIGGSRAREPSD
jgi:hypothetical protein